MAAGGGGAAADDATALPSFSCLGGRGPRPKPKGASKSRIGTATGTLSPGAGSWTECATVRIPENGALSNPCSLPSQGSEAPPRASASPVPALPPVYKCTPNPRGDAFRRAPRTDPVLSASLGHSRGLFTAWLL